MKKKFLIIIILAFVTLTFTNCNSEKGKTKESLSKQTIPELAINIFDTKGYKLMEQKCYICHFAKPDPSKRNSMIAPPMLRVQEHYKPSYPNKEDFVNAIVAWAKHPEEAKTLMPGTIRKFALMPKLNYKDKDVKLIAETLYDIDFGDAPKMRRSMRNEVQLNNNKKWRLNKNTDELVSSIIYQLEKFRSEDIAEYNQLGKNIFDKAKTMLLDTSYSEPMFNQLHIFFNNIEENVHLLISTQSIDEAKKQHLILNNKFNKFNYYFE